MKNPGKADPAIYPKLREKALELRFAHVPSGSVHAVIMDWHVGSGIATVLAAADGTGSMYLSSGGGFIGGGQRTVAIHEAALRAVQQAKRLLPHFAETLETKLPETGQVFFYLTTDAGVSHASAPEADLKSGKEALTPLGAAMQRIVTEYRMLQPG